MSKKNTFQMVKYLLKKIKILTVQVYTVFANRFKDYTHIDFATYFRD